MLHFINATEGPAYFEDPKNMNFYEQTIMGLYDNPEVMKTFFYTWAVSNDLALFYFFFYKQNIFLAGAHLQQ